MEGGKLQIFVVAGSGCGSVGRAIASNARDLQFESQHWQNFIYQCSIEKTKIKKQMAHFLQKKNILVVEHDIRI